MARSKRLQLPLDAVLRIAARDGWTCHVCGEGFISDDPWEVDHDVAISRGGSNHLANLRLCHKSCNRDKGAA